MSYVHVDLHVLLEVNDPEDAEQLVQNLKRVAEGRETCHLHAKPSQLQVRFILDEVIRP